MPWSSQCRAHTASFTGGFPAARKMHFLNKNSFAVQVWPCVRPAWEQGWCGVGLRTLHNGYSELLKVGLSQFHSHLQRAVISAPLLEHRGPFDKSLCTGDCSTISTSEKYILGFFSIIFAVHWLGRVSFSLSCCTPSGSGTAGQLCLTPCLSKHLFQPVPSTISSCLVSDVCPEQSLSQGHP